VEELAKRDAIRDDLYIAFRDSVNAFKRRRDETLQRAYLAVWSVISNIGTTAYRLGYAEQSGKMNAFFRKMEEVDLQVALNTLQLTDLYQELKEAQADFEETYSMRIQEEVRKDYPTLHDAKNELVPKVNALLTALEVLEESNAVDISELTRQVNEITVRIMAVAKARQTKSEEGKEDFEDV
jgi:hypothetical protein